METMPKSLVIITTVGKHGIIFDNIRYILRNNPQNDLTVTLAYNGTADNHTFFNKMNKIFPQVDVVVSKTVGNIPLAIRNVLKKHGSDYVFILDDDMIIFEKNWINEAIADLKKYKSIGVLGLAKGKYIDRGKEDLGYIDPEKIIRICDWAPTIMCTRREVLDKCGFDLKFPLGHYDIDWQTSIRRKGYKITQRQIKHVHIGGLSTIWLFWNNRNALKDWIYEKNKIEMYLNKYRTFLSKDYIEKERRRISEPVHEKHLLLDFVKDRLKDYAISWVKIQWYKIRHG
jgi:hypothetical protein